MNRITAALLAASTIAGVSPAHAQDLIGTVRAGTPIELSTAESLDTGNHVGSKFRMKVVNPVVRDGKVLIPAGSPATGEIVTIRTKDEPGRPSRIVARLVSVEAGGRTIRLAGGLDDAGTSLVGVIPTGTTARGFIDETVAFNEPKPIVVPNARPVTTLASVAAPAPATPHTAPPAPKPTPVLPAGVRPMPTIVLASKDPVSGPRILEPKAPIAVATLVKPSLRVEYLDKADPLPRLGTGVLDPVVVRTKVADVRPKVSVISRSRTNAHVLSGGVNTHYTY